MTELLPPEDMTVERAGALLRSELAVGDGRPREADRTVYDTFDGLLHAEHLELVHDDGRLSLIDAGSGRERAGIVMPAPTQPLLPGELPHGPLQDAVASVCGVRALLPLVEIHTRFRSLRVLDDERKTVVRMRLEEPAVRSSSGSATVLRPRVRIVAVRGYDDEFERLRERLERQLGFRVAEQSLADEALRATGGAPGGTSSKIAVALGYNQRADEAAVRVLRCLLDVIEANVDGTVADIDSEFLHDLRVSIRRSRAVQRELKRVFPAERLAWFRAEFRWLQQASGDARDLDVYVLEFAGYRTMVDESGRADLAPLLEVLREHRSSAHERLASVLRADRSATLFQQWAHFLDNLVGLPVDNRPDAARPIGAVAGERISKVYRRMTKLGAAIDESSPAEDYHELRKQGKELRYLLELFAAPLYPGEVVKPMVKALKELQDVLGRHQDREVQVATLRALRDEVAAREEGPAAVMAMGVLVEHLANDALAARRAFADRFAAFASKPQRRLVKDTFGVSKVLATYNIKGGVGKTSAAVNLAYLAARGGAPTLVWDLDPQGACTYLFRIKPKVAGGGRKLLRRRTDVDALIKGTDHVGLDLLPADFSYRHMDLALDAFKHPTRRLAGVLEPLADEYQYIFLDCPPSISLVSESVFKAADALLVPIIPATLSSRTLDQLAGVVDGAPQLLAFFSMVDRRKKLHRETIERLRAERTGMLNPVIPASATIERMGSERDVVAAFAPRSVAAIAYQDLWTAVQERLGTIEVHPNTLPAPK